MKASRLASWMVAVVIAVTAISNGGTVSPALAGVNAGGTLIVLDPALSYTTDLTDACGLGSAPASCEDADIQIDGASPEFPAVWKVYAAFLDQTSPRLKGLTWGIRYPSNVTLVAWGPCIGDLNQGAAEFPGQGWPASDTGTSLVFEQTQTGVLTECYWFAGYRDGGGSAAFELRDHPDPVLGGVFGDDSVPSILDEIAGYGTLGFDGPGTPACPQPLGACCQPDGQCLTLPQSLCDGEEWTQDLPCEPNPCDPPADPYGACCHPDGSCSWVPLADCATGDWREGVPCNPNPCPPSPWGACCDPDGHCEYVQRHECPEGMEWHPSRFCEPNPCSGPRGACCRPDGSCTYVPYEQCNPHRWIREVPCEPNPCTWGACCYPDGHCWTRIERDCNTGDWRPNVPCDPNPCSQIQGACCHPDGHCESTSESGCSTGDWRPEVPCDPNPCPQPPSGACCINGVCTVTTEYQCEGEWQGTDTVCDPNPCPPPPPQGACCFSDGSCLYEAEAECPTGDWRADVPCDPNPCPQPERPGACCIGENCSLLSEHDCCGVYQGDGTVCCPNPCAPGLGHRQVAVQPIRSTRGDTGASGSFHARHGNGAGGEVGPGHGYTPATDHRNPCDGAVLLSYDLTAENGYGLHYGYIRTPFYGAFAECYDHMGSVCGVSLYLTGVGAPCRDLTVYIWDDVCGMPGNVLSMTTGLDPCPVATWPEVSVHDFPIVPTTVGGRFWIGYWADFSNQNCGYYVAADLDGPGGCPVTNLSCDSGLPTGWHPVDDLWGPTQAIGIGAWTDTGGDPGGACCFEHGACVFTTEYGCHGQWQGPGSTCDPNPCPQPPTGACCHPDGTCWTTLEPDCPTGDWRPQVPCDPNPCPQPPTGACCINGVCTVTTEYQCAGEWMGPDTVCDPNPCPPPPVQGACCYSNGNCLYTTEADCHTGDWRQGVPCNPNPCPQPHGACCYSDGSCVYTTADQCHTGHFLPNVPCDPNPCHPPAPCRSGPRPRRLEPPEGSRTAGSVGAGEGIAVPGTDSDPCGGVLILNYDGTAENGFCWQYGGIVPPYYGAFAEQYSGHTNVCGIQLNLTGLDYPCGPFDAYVWADAGGIPGQVLSLTRGLNPCPVATWPNISTHDFAIQDTWVDEFFWIGYWADHSAQPCGYYIAADTDGFGGCPTTNIAPGIGYPTGWQPTDVVWGPTQSIGIGAWAGEGGSRIVNTTWGRIKDIYR